jgi:membrane protein
MSSEQQPTAGSPADSSTAQLVDRLSAQVSALVRREIALAAVEMKHKGSRIGTGIGISGAGGLLALYGLAAVFAAALLGLATVVAAWLAALIVGLVLLALAGMLTAAGIGQVRSGTPPVPEQAVQSTKLDIETVKESIHR